MNARALKLISFDLCPYVQRSLIALEEKGVPYEIEYIDLTAKPEWFLELSATGKVPVMIVPREGADDAVLFESSVIAEYIDETRGEGRLHPSDPLERAQHRAFVELASAFNMDVHRIYVAQDAAAADASIAAARAKVERVLAKLRGPFFAGERFSLLDAAWAPGLQRLGWCEELRPEIGLLAESGALAAWHQALVQRPSVVASTVEAIHERFLSYLAGDRGQNKRNEPRSWLLPAEAA